MCVRKYSKQAMRKGGQNFKHTFCSKGQYLINLSNKAETQFCPPFLIACVCSAIFVFKKATTRLLERKSKKTLCIIHF